MKLKNQWQTSQNLKKLLELVCYLLGTLCKANSVQSENVGQYHIENNKNGIRSKTYFND